MKLIILIPAYNEENTIVPTIKQIPKKIQGIDFIEILVVNDGSLDNTVKRVIEETKVKIISHHQNKGVGQAFNTGINYALENKADLVVNIDADGQFDPLDIPKIIEPILSNKADFVTGSRFLDKRFIPLNISFIKLWGNIKIARLVSWLARKKFYDVSCGFRAYNKEALLWLNLFGQFTYVQETLLDLSFKKMRICEVPIKVRYYKDRKSRVYKNVWHYTINILKIILKTIRDYRPLKFFGSIGVSVFIIGLVLDIFIVIFYFNTGTFTPYKSVAFAGLFLNVIGLAILFLALVADMLYRIRINQERLLYYAKKKQYYS